MTHHTLDARGLICPLPVLKARKKLLALAAGEKLVVLVTDPHAEKDFALFCAEAGHRLAGIESSGSATQITVERG
ncbi:MAG TPA: sulfurtransferase TusA family protein [Patescibacteria group bacterium]|nr:sulfurtransferase TusA family protein [Patescibacteria group bacterium]